MVTFQIEHRRSAVQFYIEQVDGTLVILSIDGIEYGEPGHDWEDTEDLCIEIADTIHPPDHGAFPKFIATFRHAPDPENILIHLYPVESEGPY